MAKKTMSIEEMIKEKEREIARLQAFETVLEKLRSELHWNYCSIMTDANGDNVRDEENDDWVWIAPTPEDWGYDRYVAYKAVLEEIMGLL